MWEIIIPQNVFQTYCKRFIWYYFCINIKFSNVINQFHSSVEERMEPFNSKLLLIPKIRESPYYHTSWKIKQFCKKIMNNIIGVKGKRWGWLVFFINQNLPNFVPIITIFPNISLKEKCLG